MSIEEIGKTEPMTIAKDDDENRMLREENEVLKETLKYMSGMNAGDFNFLKRLALEKLQVVEDIRLRYKTYDD